MPPSTKVKELSRILGGYLAEECGDAQRLFLSKDGLDGFWSQNTAGIEALLELQSPSPENHADHKKHFARITCILLRIECLEKEFPRIFQPFKLKHGLSDENLPLSIQQCRSWFGNTWAESFFQEQHNLLEPIYIERAKLINHDKHRRLPYVDGLTHIGEGAYGKVFKVKILKGYCRRAGDANLENKDLAVKCSKKDLQVETQNNEYLQGNSLKHINILVHRAAFLHNGLFHIFMDWAEYGDLETLLNGGTSKDTSSREIHHYQFNLKFPDASCRDVLKAFRDLSEALAFLHHDVKSPENGESMNLAHNDLRPQNILVFPEDGQRVGRWKITDFGISTLEDPAVTQRRSYQYETERVPGDLLRRLPAKADLKSLGGPSRAPELSSTMYKRDQKADIWSLGCCFADVLAFIQGFGSKLDDDNAEWAANRSQVRSLRDIHEGSFHSSIREGNKVTFRLKTNVRGWLEEIFNRGDVHSKECVGLICLMLRPDPQAREDSKLIRNRLNDILNHMQTRQEYAQPFTFHEDDKKVEPWRPILKQQLSVTPRTMKFSSSSSETGKSKKSRTILSVTEFALLLIEESSRGNKILSTQPVETTSFSTLIGEYSALPDHAVWTGMQLSGAYGCATSSSRNGPCEYIHFNLETQKAQFSDESEVKNPALKFAVPTSNGMIALCYDNLIRLKSFEYDLDERLKLRDEGTLNCVVFNEKGDKLFARTTHESRQDYLVVWGVSLEQRPSRLAFFEVERPSHKVDRNDFHTVLPWLDNIGALMIYRHNGSGLVYSALTKGKQQADRRARYQLTSDHYPATATVSAAVTKDFFIFVDLRGKVWLCKLGSNSKGDEISLENLGSTKLPVKSPSWLVLRRNEDSTKGSELQLVIGEPSCISVYDVELSTDNKKRGWSLRKVN